MVKFLLKRPIAVIMAFLAVVILGCVTFASLPVSLLPDIAIPHISVQVSGDNMSARELENTMVAPLRRQLMQISGLDEIRSETRDGYGIIKLTMDYGVNTDLAFIEVNEKIDAAMNSLPRESSRPKAVKASATDIPVLYLHMTQKDDIADDRFLEVSEIAANIVRRRIEQLPEVAMADITGVPGKVLRLQPDYDRMRSAGITTGDIEAALAANNAEPGSMTVRDGYYEYNIHVANQLRTPDDVKNVKLMKNRRMHTLGDFCKVDLTEQAPSGYSLYNSKRAVTMAIIKQATQSMDRLEEAVDGAVSYFSTQYPDIEFATSRSQTQLLDFTISNLEQNLILGLILVFIVCALFMRSARLPFIIGITIIVAVIVTFLLFYLFHVSINIISLAGLILAIGMMIDNSVIVAENITQFRQRGLTLAKSCIAGTNEMITPMLSSSLTTVAVFVPLVFMRGIAGAIFADQAFAITAGLAASYIVGITLMPVLYHLFFRKNNATPHVDTSGNGDRMSRLYDRGIDWVFSHKVLSIGFISLSIAAAIPLFKALDSERMPKTDSSETMVSIDWNENISITENRKRTADLLSSLDGLTEEHSAFIGSQDFTLDNSNLSETETELYLRTMSPDSLASLRDVIAGRLAERYPGSTFSFYAPDNIFEKVFSTDEPALEARLSLKSGQSASVVDKATRLRKRIEASTGKTAQELPLRQQINISLDYDRMALYGVDYAEVKNVLRTAFSGKEAATLRSYQEYLPVHIADKGSSLEEVLSSTLIKSKLGGNNNTEPADVPLSAITRLSRSMDFKTVTSDQSGEYIPVALDVKASEADDVIQKINSEVAADGSFDVALTGTLFSNTRMMKELAVILVVSILLMYFILCAQLESFVQPLIVLLEIPIDISFALLSLLIFGQTLNLMSAIGIIVTCGIVVNDSILKLDAINELRKSGMPLYEAIHTAGHRRLKPIVMTSLTTIFAMVPVLFTSDMGSELQRPLAIAMIGSMTVGTLVSIFIIPLIYFLIYRRQHAPKDI
ncbi:MAG: efflux RND transporter permease subunit [Muribaculaceae bacterium]|nr:efflux RND transporter permease subunit [Muribaculaceae bacterium]